MPKNLLTTQSKIAQAKRRAQIMHLRMYGDGSGRRMTHREIAEKLDCSVGTVYNNVRDAIDELQAETKEYAIAIRQKDVDTCEEIINIMMPKVRNDQDPQAAATILKAIERKAKLLGNDAPAKSELTGADGGPIVVTKYADMATEELIKLMSDKLAMLKEEEDDSTYIDAEVSEDRPLLPLREKST